tara:strand:- start:201 stop:1751 length:1551 start_codon:yes stop_codon:yes gene_type:complete
LVQITQKFKMKNKIINIENIRKILSERRRSGKKIVQCHGVFDLLHLGHIRHFKEAKNYGDILVVSITSDKFVNKGPGRPAFNELQRLESISALGIVDYVVLNNHPSAVQAITQIRPNFYCKGPDYKNHAEDITNKIKLETGLVRKYGGKTIYTKDITFSSSSLLNSFSGIYSKKHKSTINKIKKKYPFNNIKKIIDQMKKLKVLIIGETIIDQYNFCEALGKSGKEPVLVLRDLKTEQYLGGSAAISRHLSSFCNKITLLSMVGEKGEYLKEINKTLPKNISFKYIRKKNSPTIIKRRFLDYVANNKVLGVYSINDEILNIKDEKLFNNYLNKTLKNHDLVIVSDYGHGLISKKSAKLISQKAKFLALNAQINAANIGYHNMRNYKNLDCVIINDREIRHEMRDKTSTIKDLMRKLSNEQNIQNLVVTKGTEGSLFLNKKSKKFYSSQAYSTSAVDKIGAGDAMLSIIALCIKSGFPEELSLIVSSLAAAQSVKTIGNKEAINKVEMLKTLDHFLK